MERIGIFIQPSGPLFFRSGKPMDANGRARSDLPNPQVLAGAVTTLLLRNAGCNLHKLGEFTKKNSDKENLFKEALKHVCGEYAAIADVRFKGPWVSASPDKGGIDPLLAPPSHLRTKENGKEDGKEHGKEDGKTVMLRPLAEGKDLPNWKGVERHEKLRPLWYNGKWDFDKKKGISAVKHSDLKDLLSGNETSAPNEPEDRDKPYGWVTRSGIQVDNSTNTVKESMLFTQELLELRDEYGFYAELEVDEKVKELLADGPHQVFFGGDSKTARLELLKKPFSWNIDSQPGEKQKDGEFAVLTSPAFFTPESPALPKHEKLVAAAVSGEYFISGWDLAKGGPKPTRFGVPAGSVYFFKGQIPPGYNGSLCKGEDARIGWGTYLKGSWNYV